MIEGGSLGTHVKEHSKLGISGSFQIVDDGTYYLFKVGGATIFQIRKSDGQFMIAGGYDSDVTLS